MSSGRAAGTWCSPGMGEALVRDLRWLVVDVETTGLDPARHTITEFATFAVVGDRVDVVGLDLDEGLEAAASWTRAGAVVVGHNVAFDLGFLVRHPKAPVALHTPSRWMCTYRAGDRSRTLAGLAADLGVPVVGRHSAEGDARALAGVMLRLLADVRDCDAITVAEMVAPLRGQDLTRKGHAGESPVLGSLRAGLDHVVPSKLPSREQRRALAHVATSEGAATGQIGEHDRIVAVLRDAGITCLTFDLLLAELETDLDT